eukprot:TRINITY_DN16059_c0_g1_i1.p1 TRINITY_DN16059_c0_g1~~TRINITY_DN16059_c0_g1_i1.p1  ORF type:complete len:160 (+),score=47.29 TRINITY_DN16059_c0_g1_i1:43-522(+)
MSSQETIRVLCTLPYSSETEKVKVLCAAVEEDFGNLVFGVRDMRLLTDVVVERVAMKEREGAEMRRAWADIVEQQKQVVEDLKVASSKLSILLNAASAPARETPMPPNALPQQAAALFTPTSPKLPRLSPLRLHLPSTPITSELQALIDISRRAYDTPV